MLLQILNSEIALAKATPDTPYPKYKTNIKSKVTLVSVTDI